jgi:hypothetical protein
MPYAIIKSGKGYKVALKANKKKVFSKKPLSLTRAKKQEKAIILSELRRGKKI